MSKNKPIERMTVNDCVGAWIEDVCFRTRTPYYPEAARSSLVSDCEDFVKVLRRELFVGSGVVNKAASNAAMSKLLSSWNNKFRVTPNLTSEHIARLSDGLESIARPGHADLIHGEFGTAYSVGEARKAAEGDGIDEYHSELILWLCDEVEHLKAILPSPSPEPVNKDDLLNQTRGRNCKQTLAGSLFLSAFTHTFPLGNGKAARSKKCQELMDAKEVQLVLLANGVPLDAMKACAEWDKQVDRMVAEKARQMVEEKFGETNGRVFDLLYAVESHLKQQMRDAGIRLPEED